MNDDLKQKIMLFAAIFITFIWLTEYYGKKLPKQEEKKAEQHQSAEQPATETPDPANTATQTKKTPDTPGTESPAGKPPSKTTEPLPASEIAKDIYSIRIVTAVRDDIDNDNPDGYEATFTTVGAALKRYRLLRYFNTPEKLPGDEVILLDELSAGRHSLVVNSVKLGKSGDLKTVRGLNYHLVAVPTGAMVQPEPAKDVTIGGTELVFRAEAISGKLEIIKRYIFDPERSDGFTVSVEIRSLLKTDTPLVYELVGPSGFVADDPSSRYGQIYLMSASLDKPPTEEASVDRVALETAVEEENRMKKDARGNLVWSGGKNRFFVSLLAANDRDITIEECRMSAFPGDESYYKKDHPTLVPLMENIPRIKVNDKKTGIAQTFIAGGEASLVIRHDSLDAESTLKHGFTFYGGPADDDLLLQAHPCFNRVISYTVSWFDFISRFLVKIVGFLQKLVINYGVAIILLTIIVKSCMHPLTRKMLTSSQKMQKVAPLAKEIQKRYKNDKQRMHTETMALYKKHGVNPVGGCLPLFIQMPIFFALYGVFSQGFNIRQAVFIPGWIDDLSQPDSICHLGFKLPILGSSELSLLPILYLVLQLIQMSMQPKSNDPQVAQQQKMMKFMPIFFVFIFYSMPAGLVLYFTISSLYTLMEHWIIKRHLARKSDDDTDGGDGGTLAAVVPGETAAPLAAAGTGIGGGGKRKKKK